MPSHSVKQAKVMSAIAHGWHPSQGSVAKIPLSVAKDFHAADVGHKYGKGMDKAKRITKRFRKKARGGAIEGDDRDDVTYHGTLPKPLQPMTTNIPEGLLKGPPGTYMPRDISPKFRTPYADGGDTADDMVEAAHRQLDTQQDRLPPVIHPEGDVVDWSRYNQPFGEMKSGTPAWEHYQKTGKVEYSPEDIEQGVNIGMASGPGIMVGPYGAYMLRAANRAATQPHPVYGEAAKQAGAHLRPEFQDIYKGWQADARDAEARARLEMRQASGNPYDTDVWQGAGWHRGAEGLPRKEIPDIGASLVPAEGGGYHLQHPAGDLHKIYDIPPIQFDASMKRGTAAFDPKEKQIVIGGRPDQKSVATALHEFQHAIQQSEGFASGSNPMVAAIKGPMGSEYFPGNHPSWWTGTSYAGEEGPNAITAALEPERGAMFNTYERSAGEVEARNVPNRRAKGYRYQSHPEDTEDVPRGLQWEDLRHVARPREDIKIHEVPPSTAVPEGEHRVVPNDFDESSKFGSRQAGIGNIFRFNRPDSERLSSKLDANLLARHMRAYGHDAQVEHLPTLNESRVWVKHPTDPDKIAYVYPKHASDPRLPLDWEHYKRGGRKFASGGSVSNFNPERSAAYGLARQGMLHSPVPGRTDKLNLDVPSGSYVIPADIPSALGQGNSMAGANVLNKMFAKGPYGMNLGKTKGPRTHARAASLSKIRFADGGQTQVAPIVAAGGEYIVHPESVAALGNGDMDLGHDILDSFVKQIRDNNIKTLKGLKPPKGSK